MDNVIVGSVRRSKQNKLTDELVELYKERSSSYSEEFFEAIRQILVERGVSDSALDLSPPQTRQQTGPASQASRVSHGHAGFAVVGGLAGGFVGYLVGTSPMLSFGDVLTRGALLERINGLFAFVNLIWPLLIL
jgi:hypothetical protein